jgi:hypothetical protein
MPVTYNINDDLILREQIFRSVWRNLPYPLAKIRNGGGQKIDSLPEIQYNYTRNALGVPLFFPLSFIDDKGDGSILQLPDAPLVQIECSKTIIKTAVAGRDFTVKEIISANDYTIAIRGIKVIAEKAQAFNTLGETDTKTLPTEYQADYVDEVFPGDFMQELNKWFLKNRDLRIDCELTSLLGIQRIVMEDIKFPLIEGYVSVLPYEIKCVSDTEWELQLK